MQHTKRIVRKIPTMALLLGVVACLICGCPDSSDDNACDACADVPDNASFSIDGQDVAISCDDTGVCTLTMDADDRVRWETADSDQSGYIDLDCMARLWEDRFSQEETPSVVMYRDIDTSDTAWFFSVVTSFSADNDGATLTFGIVPLTDSVPEELESAVLMLNRACPNARCLGREVNGYCIQSFADLSEADLSGTDLSEADLFGANLSWANLRGANLHWANLRFANLSGTDLSWADLFGANLSWANLRGANLYWADLRFADLSGADLSGAKLFADLSDTSICSTIAPDGTWVNSVNELRNHLTF